MEAKRYGVNVTAIERLKEFQIRLLKNSRVLPATKMDFSQTLTVILNQLQPVRTTLSVGFGLLFLDQDDGNSFRVPLNQMASVSISDFTVKIQFNLDQVINDVTIQFEDEGRLNAFISTLPPIPRPPMDELATSNSSSSSSSDSARGVTHDHHSSDASGEDLAAALDL